MLKKLLTISLFLAFFASLLPAQSRIILRPNGEKIPIKKNVNLREAIQDAHLKTLSGIKAGNVFHDVSFNTQGTLDTLKVGDLGLFDTNFGFFGQDVFLQYFVAPADLIIKAAGFATTDVAGAAAGLTLRLVKLNATYDELVNIPAALYLGYYPSDGDGYNNADFFGESATGPWIDKTGGAYPIPFWADNVDPAQNTFDYDLWSDATIGAPVTPVLSADAADFNWVQMNLLFEPQVNAGEVFAVVVTHEGTTLDGDRVGMFAGTSFGIPGLKYYENGRLDPADPGWWARKYSWDFVVAVDLIGDRAPVISGVTTLLTTLSTDPQTVEATITDDNPSGGPAGVATAFVSFSTDTGATWTDVSMTANGDLYSADIPGQSPGTLIMYKVVATDVGGLTTETLAKSYSIYAPTPGVTTLLVFDGQDGIGYPEEYYFGHDDFANFTTIQFDHDVWAFGQFDNTLVDNYSNVFEFVTGGPQFYHRDVISNWLGADATRNYFLAGQEWLGSDNGFTDQDYAAGTFEYDVLGISHSYNDVSYDGTSGQGIPSLIFAQQGSTLGGALYDLFQANGPTDSLRYDPVFEHGGINNWMDAFEVAPGAEVDVTVETRGILGVPAVEVHPTAVNNTTANGNKVAFLAYDPISINSSPDYYWYGFSETAPQVQAGEWFGAIVVGVEDEEALPTTFKLSQNYPNPFNPSTLIKYSLPEKSNVSIKVYDMLGQQVATLVNQVKGAGNYEVNFDASKLTSGVYIYKIEAGNFVSSKKMMLLK